MSAKRGDSYNYTRFRMSNYELGYFPGPKAGEKVDFGYHFTDLNGEDIDFGQYKGKWLVLETGSLTCPMYVKNVNPFIELQKKHPDVEWLVVYVREAHPGSKLGPAKDIDEKISYAKRSVDEYGEQRKVVVDSVDGKWHHDFGLLPNMVYVINPEGTVVYRADWSFAKNVDKVLQNREKLHTGEHVVIMGTPPWVFIPVSLKGGWDAVWDMIHELPKLLWSHVKEDVASLKRKFSARSGGASAATGKKA